MAWTGWNWQPFKFEKPDTSGFSELGRGIGSALGGWVNEEAVQEAYDNLMAKRKAKAKPATQAGAKAVEAQNQNLTNQEIAQNPQALDEMSDAVFAGEVAAAESALAGLNAEASIADNAEMKRGIQDAATARSSDYVPETISGDQLAREKEQRLKDEANYNLAYQAGMDYVTDLDAEATEASAEVAPGKAATEENVDAAAANAMAKLTGANSGSPEFWYSLGDEIAKLGRANLATRYWDKGDELRMKQATLASRKRLQDKEIEEMSLAQLFAIKRSPEFKNFSGSEQNLINNAIELKRGQAGSGFNGQSDKTAGSIAAFWNDNPDFDTKEGENLFITDKDYRENLRKQVANLDMMVGANNSQTKFARETLKRYNERFESERKEWEKLDENSKLRAGIMKTALKWAEENPDKELSPRDKETLVMSQLRKETGAAIAPFEILQKIGQFQDADVKNRFYQDLGSAIDISKYKLDQLIGWAQTHIKGKDLKNTLGGEINATNVIAALMITGNLGPALGMAGATSERLTETAFQGAVANAMAGLSTERILNNLAVADEDNIRRSKAFSERDYKLDDDMRGSKVKIHFGGMTKNGDIVKDDGKAKKPKGKAGTAVATASSSTAKPGLSASSAAKTNAEELEEMNSEWGTP
jgi:hypothetical protein